ncbi:hypothetical protein GW765_01180 [Candidatus Parcubacteria bacterium]|nr:hypothetical protein [Candidatus Parcubacteria bacterium]
MKIQSSISKQTTLLLILAISFATLFLPLTSLKATTLTNGMNAEEIVFGSTAASQDFGSVGSSTASINSGYVYSSNIDTINHRFFVTGYLDNRVLIYNLNEDNTFPDYDADYVLGQSDFTSTANTTTQSGLYYPLSTAQDENGNYLFVVDAFNNRVLVYDLSGGITNGMNASYVLGQDDFVSRDAGVFQDSFAGFLVDISYDNDNDRLFVSDLIGNRVLVYDLSEGITSGMNASYVLGQEDFTSDVATTTQNGLNYVSFIDYIPELEYLFVNDSKNFRTVVYDLSGGITNGMNTSYVLGQDDFVSAEIQPVTASTFAVIDVGQGNVSYQRYSYDSLNQRFFLSDGGSSRVLIYDVSAGFSSGMTPEHVIGQDDFVSSSANKGQVSPGQSTFASPNEVQYDSVASNLYVSDFQNNRVLRFNLTPTPTTSGFSYTHPPLCTATITPNTITKGEEATLSWNINWPTNRQSSYYMKVPKNGIYSHRVNSIRINPKYTTNYNLAAINMWGANFCDTTVTVLDEEGVELINTNTNLSSLSASAGSNPFFRAITSFFARLFVR